MSIDDEIRKEWSKNKVAKKVNLPVDEILTIENLNNFPASPTQTPGLQGFNPHLVTYNKERGWAYIAKAINTQLDQNGKGDYRYFFQDKKFTGIVLVHTNKNREYRRS